MGCWDLDGSSPWEGGKGGYGGGSEGSGSDVGRIIYYTEVGSIAYYLWSIDRYIEKCHSYFLARCML